MFGRKSLGSRRYREGQHDTRRSGVALGLNKADLREVDGQEVSGELLE
jgi:hypothetical protein